MNEPTPPPPAVNKTDSLIGLVIILSFLGLGELTAQGFGLPFPGNVLGMLLLFIGLCTGLVRQVWVEAASAAILQHLGLYFVPAGVGLMLYGNLIQQSWVALVAATIVSTVAVLWTTGLVTRFVSKTMQDDT